MLSRTSSPTAVTAFNDHCAAGMLATVRKRGVGVPENLSLVGYDDSRIASFATVALNGRPGRLRPRRVRVEPGHRPGRQHGRTDERGPRPTPPGRTTDDSPARTRRSGWAQPTVRSAARFAEHLTLVPSTAGAVAAGVPSGAGRISRLSIGGDVPAVSRERPYDDHVQRDEDDGPHRVVRQPQEVCNRYQGRHGNANDPSPQGAAQQRDARQQDNHPEDQVNPIPSR